MYNAFIRYSSWLGLFIYPISAIAQSTNTAPELTHEIFERLHISERNIQELLNKIEILEHSVNTLKQQVNKSIAADTGNVDYSHSSSEHIQNNKSAIDTTPPNKGILVYNEESLYQQALLTFKEVGNLKNKQAKTDKFLAAQQQFEKFLKEYPNSQLSANAYFWLGEISFRLGELLQSKEDFSQAILHYMQAYNRAKKTKNDKAMDALLKIGLSLGKLGKHNKACQVLKKLDEEFPPAERTEDSKMQAREASEKYNCKIIKHD